jgi:hypothetical protein
VARRIERIPLPDPAQLRRALEERVEGLCPGARVVDADVQGPTGVDLLLVDDDGRPVFVDIVLEGAGEIPARVFDHARWFEQNRRLFLKAYTEEGVVRIEDPAFVFVGARFPASVVAAVAAMSGLAVRLVRVESFLIDGSTEVLLEDVTPQPTRTVSTPVARRTDEMPGESKPQAVIESDAVRALLALFRSGVDGLDGRVAVRETSDRISFGVGGRRLAEVVVSPGSFTVSPGDGLINPIVVSDRVSLERALNAVVSLFVREGSSADGGNGHGDAVELADEEREVLAEIWGGGVHTGEGG